MHELAITRGILDIVDREARRNGVTRVNRIKLRIGEFTGVVKEALEFSFEVIREGTVAEHAALDIEIVPLIRRCPACESTLASSGGPAFLCPRCSGPVEILSGREMQIEYIDGD